VNDARLNKQLAVAHREAQLCRARLVDLEARGGLKYALWLSSPRLWTISAPSGSLDAVTARLMVRHKAAQVAAVEFSRSVAKTTVMLSNVCAQIASAVGSDDDFDITDPCLVLGQCHESILLARTELRRIAGVLGVQMLDSRSAIILRLLQKDLTEAALDIMEIDGLLFKLSTPVRRQFHFPVAVSALARSLTDVAVAALPETSRERFAEEWAAELIDLAEAPRRSQLLHALRQLMRVPMMRRRHRRATA
jgi:hypothetical protein